MIFRCSPSLIRRIHLFFRRLVHAVDRGHRNRRRSFQSPRKNSIDSPVWCAMFLSSSAMRRQHRQRLLHHNLLDRSASRKHYRPLLRNEYKNSAALPVSLFQAVFRPNLIVTCSLYCHQANAQAWIVHTVHRQKAPRPCDIRISLPKSPRNESHREHRLWKRCSLIVRQRGGTCRQKNPRRQLLDVHDVRNPSLRLLRLLGRKRSWRWRFPRLVRSAQTAQRRIRRLGSGVRFS